jgi:hypothetical protein
MKRIGFLLLAVVTVASVVVHMAHASGQSDGDSSPIYGVKIPAGYRDWQLIVVKQLPISPAWASNCALNSATI